MKGYTAKRRDYREQKPFMAWSGAIVDDVYIGRLDSRLHPPARTTIPAVPTEDGLDPDLAALLTQDSGYGSGMIDDYRAWVRSNQKSSQRSIAYLRIGMAYYRDAMTLISGGRVNHKAGTPLRAGLKELSKIDSIGEDLVYGGVSTKAHAAYLSTTMNLILEAGYRGLSAAQKHAKAADRAIATLESEFPAEKSSDGKLFLSLARDKLRKYRGVP